MNKSEQAQSLLERLPVITESHKKAQASMILARAALETAEREYKEAKVTALALSDGKNAEKREAEANSNIRVLDAKQEFQQAQATFNRAYFEYKTAEADLMYIRDATALLREM